MPRPIIAIVGLGSAGRRHFRNLLTLVPDAKFVLVRRERTMPAGVEIGDADVYLAHSLVEACSFRPDMAVIANVTAKHVEAALAFARNSDTHLFIEKPLSHNMDGVQELSQLCEQRVLTTMVGYQYRFHPMLVQLKQQLAAGEFGRVVSVRAEWGEYLPDWHPGEDHRTSYAADADSGGVILTLSHPLDYVRWLFGELVPLATVLDVPGLETPCRDDVAEIMKLGSITGTVHLDYVQRFPPRHELTIIGTKRTERIDLAEHGFDRNGMFLDEMREFLAAAAERRPSAIPLSEGIATLEVCLEARRDAGL